MSRYALFTARRFGPLLVAGAAGMVDAAGLALKVPAHWEHWLSAPAGFAAGVIGGLTNAPVTPLVLYFQAIGLPKNDFVASVAFSSIFFEAVQLAAVTWYGLLPWRLLGMTLALLAVALAGFVVGLRVQDRLAFLAVLGAWLLVRSLS